jgi:hypothetical protein
MSVADRLRARTSTTSAVVISGILFVLSQVWILRTLDTIAPDLLTLQTTFSRDTFNTIVSQWSADDLERFRTHFYLDLFIHPILYSTFVCGAAAKLLNAYSIPERFNWMLYVPFLGGASDIVENAAHVAMLPDMTDAPYLLLAIGSTFALIKWIVLGGLVLLILVLMLHYITFQRKKGNPKGQTRDSQIGGEL